MGLLDVLIADADPAIVPEPFSEHWLLRPREGREGLAARMREDERRASSYEWRDQ
jgi:hypothetical protein